MGKQYISTASIGQAHELDIFGVCVTNKYTITVSSDGYANFWTNKLQENSNPKETMERVFINKVGIHHVSSLESALPDSSIRVVLLAFVCFDGSLNLQYYINEDLSTLKQIKHESFANKNWAPGFYKDPQSIQDYLFCTKANGTIAINTIHYQVTNDDLTITIESLPNLNFNVSSFPHSLSVCQTDDKFLAVGFENGDVVLSDFVHGKIIYTFHSSDLQISKKSGSKSIPRVLEFSPGGTMLVVARDIQSAGSITIYDVKYGENIGSLTCPSHSSKATVGGFAHDGWIMGLSFDEEGNHLLSCGFDKCARIWNLQTREREATINISVTDLDDSTHDEEQDTSIASGCTFIRKGIRSGSGGDTNEGMCIISFDRGVRWYREAGGI
jgi:superkiller protein 8